MGVRVGRAHDLAAVLEHLDPLVLATELDGFICPDIDHVTNGIGRHQRQGQVVAGAETQNVTGAFLALGQKEAVLDPLGRGPWTKGREVIREDVGRVVDRVSLAACADVAGAQIAVWVERGQCLSSGRLAPSLPGAARATGRNEDPLVKEWVVAAVRLTPESIERWVDLRPAEVAHRGEGLPVASTRDATGEGPPFSPTRTSSRTSRRSAAHASSPNPESVISTSAWSRRPIELIPTTPHFVWSARTMRRRPASTSARFVSASSRFGVVNPECGSMPCTPMNTRSTWIVRRAETAKGPTSASLGVRTPPVTMIVWSGRPIRYRTSATGTEFVTTVRPSMSVSRRARA